VPVRITHDALVSVLDTWGFQYDIDQDGDYRMIIGRGETPDATVYITPTAIDDQVLQLDGNLRLGLPERRFDEVVALCNDWNAMTPGPRAWVRGGMPNEILVVTLTWTIPVRDRVSEDFLQNFLSKFILRCVDAKNGFRNALS
jgi:hypothetical protein